MARRVPSIDREPFGGHASNVRLRRYPGTNNYWCFGDDRSTVVPSLHVVLHLGCGRFCVCGILSRPRLALDLLLISTGMMMGWLLLADLMPFSVFGVIIDR